MNIHIRKYCLDDYDLVKKIIFDSFCYEKENLTSKYIHEFSILCDQKIIGYFYLMDDIDIIRGIKILHLHYLCIDLNYRGQGISNNVMDFILDYAKENNIDRIELTSKKERIAAHKLYDKYGFKQVKTELFRKDF